MHSSTMAHHATTALSRKPQSVRVPPNTNPYKLVACDMDGTLLNSKHSISDFTRRVLSQLLARGVHVIFATGRPFTDVYRIKRRLNIFAAQNLIPTPGLQVLTPVAMSPLGKQPTEKGIAAGGPLSGIGGSVDSLSQLSCTSDASGHGHAERVVPRCFAITSNGACIYNEVNERLYEKSIHPRLCKALYGMFMDDPEVNVNVFRGVDAEDRSREGYVNLSDKEDDKASEEWVSRYPADLEAALYKESHFTFRVVPDIESSFPVTHVNEIFFLCYNGDKTRKVETDILTQIDAVRSELGIEEGVRVAPSTTYCLDVIPSDVSKASALSHVLDILHLSMSDCIAFGDGLNDVEMLSSVGKGCVMQNANPRLKETLPHLEVIGCNDEDGVARKLCEVFQLDLEE